MGLKKNKKEIMLISEDQKTRELTENLVNLLENKKLINIQLINLEKVNPYFCFFIIATANSNLQVRTIAKDIEKNFGDFLYSKPGAEELESGWIIFDFINVIVHIFLPELRNYYALERLWGDAKKIYSSETRSFQW